MFFLFLKFDNQKANNYFLSTYFYCLLLNSILKSCFIQLVKVTNVNVLKKNKIEKKIGKKLNYNLLPKSFIKDDLDLMPLSTFKKTMILGSNENNYYPYFLTDRYGFLKR